MMRYWRDEAVATCDEGSHRINVIASPNWVFLPSTHLCTIAHPPFRPSLRFRFSSSFCREERKKTVQNKKTPVAPVFTKKENATSAQQIEILDWHHAQTKPSQTKTAQHFDAIYPNLGVKRPVAVALDVSSADRPTNVADGQLAFSYIHQEIRRGKSAKAIFPGNGHHRQEAVLTVVGVLKEMDLPPVRKTEWVPTGLRSNLAVKFFLESTISA
jgi:hypothetical protein